MNVIEVNTGEKISYTTSKNKITFADELMLNLEKYERDYAVSIDICIDANGSVVTGLGKIYAAQIEIPARSYTESTEANPDYDPEDESSQETITTREPVPFDMATVTLKLYAI